MGVSASDYGPAKPPGWGTFLFIAVVLFAIPTAAVMIVPAPAPPPAKVVRSKYEAVVPVLFGSQTVYVLMAEDGDRICVERIDWEDATVGGPYRSSSWRRP